MESKQALSAVRRNAGANFVALFADPRAFASASIEEQTVELKKLGARLQVPVIETNGIELALGAIWASLTISTNSKQLRVSYLPKRQAQEFIQTLKTARRNAADEFQRRFGGRLEAISSDLVKLRDPPSYVRKYLAESWLAEGSELAAELPKHPAAELLTEASMEAVRRVNEFLSEPEALRLTCSPERSSI